MELAFLFTPLSPEPIELAEARYTLAGATAPIVLVPDWIDPATRSSWVVESDDLPLAVRVRAALSAERHAAAWALIGPEALADTETVLALELWAARRLAAAELEPRHAAGVVVVGAERHARRVIAQRAAAALGDVSEQIAHPLWPPWAGPVAVVVGEEEALDLPGDADGLYRPALPVLRVNAELPATELREHLAGRLCDLVLTRLEGAAPWPDWFRTGMAGVARARARGEGPSPRQMAEIRRRAGPETIRRGLILDRIDAELATALVAYACHRRRVGQLISFMELLRNDADALSAFQIAYRADLETLTGP